jgi:hypothetical protein
LIDCWTLKAAKKIRPDPAYSILFGHLHFRIEGFCSGYIAKNTMKIAPAAASAAQADSR